jgi:hypothetical protein
VAAANIPTSAERQRRDSDHPHHDRARLPRHLLDDARGCASVGRPASRRPSSTVWEDRRATQKGLHGPTEAADRHLQGWATTTNANQPERWPSLGLYSSPRVSVPSIRLSTGRSIRARRAPRCMGDAGAHDLGRACVTNCRRTKAIPKSLAAALYGGRWRFWTGMMW